MSKMKISEYFNPDQHLTLHQDKEGNMIGGGYQVNNLLYQRKMPLFVSLGDGGRKGAMSGGAGAGAGAGAGDDCENHHFIPEKFSDLFRDLAVPAGLFMMPPQFRPRNYAFEIPEEDAVREKKRDDGDDGDDGDSSDSSDGDDRKTVPTDIFDTLLSLVTPTERIHHDVKTRRQRQQIQHPNKTDKKRQNKTRRARA
jgi:hypothetical protein